jgi:hypothetical protein
MKNSNDFTTDLEAINAALQCLTMPGLNRKQLSKFKKAAGLTLKMAILSAEGARMQAKQRKEK